MPRLSRPEGVELHWEKRGDGPLVVLSTQFFGHPGVFGALISDLARDHGVVTYDPRGAGASTRQGPYDMETDAADLGAVIEEVGGAALAIGMGDGTNRAVRLAADRPDLVTAVLTPGGNPVGREAAHGTDALVDSPSVLQALVGMIETDYRAALRTMVAGANPEMEGGEARERVNRVVEYCPQEVGAARLRAWIADEALERARALGDRLWILSFSQKSNPWFTEPALDRTRELLPEAHIENVEGGALSRPELTAAIARRITSQQAVQRTASAERA